MKVLVLFPKRLWETKVSPARRHVIRALKRTTGVRVKVSGQGWPDWDATNDGPLNVNRLMPDADAVLWYKPQGAREVPPIKGAAQITRRWLVVETFNECHAGQAVESAKLGTGLMVLHHANDRVRAKAAVRKHHPAPDSCRIVHVAHCAEREVFAAAARPWDGRDTDVVLTGVLSSEYYPFRCRLADLIQRKKLPGQCVVHRHPGYRAKNLAACDERVKEYAKLLGRSKIALGCSSRFRYALAHYVEKAMAGCLVVGDLPDQAGHERFVVGLNPVWSDKQIAFEIGHWLSNPIDAAEKAMQGHELVLDEYTQEQYVKRLLAAIQDCAAGGQ